MGDFIVEQPRKNIRLWQAYIRLAELEKISVSHQNRLKAIERGDSEMDAYTEEVFLEQIDAMIKNAKKELIAWGSTVPVWDWLTSIKGLKSGKLPAQLLAQFDDVAKFDTVSKFWRFAGWAIAEYWADEKGKTVLPVAGWKWKGSKGDREKVWTVPAPKPGWQKVKRIDLCMEGWMSPYNRRLKSVVWLIVDQFVKQNTLLYRELYDEEKARQRRLHPEKIKTNGKWKYNDGHIDNRARRKVAKIFLQHLWVKWREAEGLPVSKPWIEAVAGHTHIVQPLG